jgi:hypothetical protein
MLNHIDFKVQVKLHVNKQCIVQLLCLTSVELSHTNRDVIDKLQLTVLSRSRRCKINRESYRYLSLEADNQQLFVEIVLTYGGQITN